MRNNLPTKFLERVVYDETSPSCLRYVNHHVRSWIGKPTGFHIRCGKRQKVYAHVVVWILHYGDPGDKIVDHIDRDRTNNKISNLRLASPSQNSKNSGSSAISGYKGVYKHRKKWRVVISGKIYGSFETPELAAQHYNQIIKQTHGDFAVSNPV